MNWDQSNGRITAGVSLDIPGMSYKHPETGIISGFEPDLVRLVAHEILGSTDGVEFLQVKDAERVQDLRSGRVDVVVSQMTITPDRAEQVDFSKPYCVTREGLLVPSGSSITCFDDLREKRIAVTEGSISLRRMRTAIPSLPGATLVVTPFSVENLEAVVKDEADAASNDMINLTMLRASLAEPEAYSIIDIGNRFDLKPFGMAVRKGNSALLELLNQVIASLQDNGEIDRMLTKSLTILNKF
ncbi:substrate-binding periplasmic protein [Methylobacterium sp. E-066]|uniref:substrate-binding periplasmic protein n=1 Tax=Methylobacterium sp. E-066 TaxID=2836584 RepID=UPI001FB9E9BC|nr:transporter substrate-binding domain-containing protein [Methylobacterium sp. E-066]MCJ2139982.1 transporter substrate-binding domain-containing protein [Methylobacterium sp. E-066]